MSCTTCATDPDRAELCGGHSESVERLAMALARMIHEDDADLIAASWFIDDADVIAEAVPEGAGWVTVSIPERDNVFMVNGVAFWVDPNEDGGGIPRPLPEDDEQ